MIKYKNRIVAAAMSAILAVSSTGCSASEIGNTILQKLEDLVAMTGLFGNEGDGNKENAAGGATAGSTGMNAESAAEEEPGQSALSKEAERRRSEGKNLNIYCWDDSLEALFLLYYPGYEDIGDRTGKIGDVTVNWIVPDDESKYMELLAERLLTAEYLDKDDKVDLYLAPEEDLAIYVNSDYSLDVREKLGLTDEELEDQFAFTQQMASTDEGVLKAVTWQASPGVFVYRRSIAKKVLGSGDPEAVQKNLEDWAKFDAAAAKMNKEKYYMVSGYYDTYSAYRFGADQHWEERGELVIPEAFKNWKEQMALYTKKGYTNKTTMGSDAWVADQGPGSKVFGFFRAITDIDSKMAAYSLADIDEAPAEGNGIYGDFGVCCGPQSFCRGGVWILAAPSSDNLILDKEIMENFTCNSDLLYKISKNENIFTNTVSGMRKMARSGLEDPFLGGQNPYEVYFDAASRLSVTTAGNYDRWMADTFRSSLLKYFKGEMSEYDAMLEFYDEVKERYPELDTEAELEKTEEEEEERIRKEEAARKAREKKKKEEEAKKKAEEAKKKAEEAKKSEEAGKAGQAEDGEKTEKSGGADTSGTAAEKQDTED